MPITRERSADFWQYMVRQWKIANANKLVPEAILIDGRFRVASFLYIFISARKGTVIMFDDYLDREHYFISEKYCKLHKKYGRMGVFYAQQNYSTTDLVATISEYSTIWS